MAAVVVDRGFDLNEFRRHLIDRLPAYARPSFLRLVRELDVTVTFKQKKSDLVQEGYNPSTIKDRLYFNDASRNAFVRLDQDLFNRIQAGQVRV